MSENKLASTPLNCYKAATHRRRWAVGLCAAATLALLFSCQNPFPKNTSTLANGRAVEVLVEGATDRSLLDDTAVDSVSVEVWNSTGDMIGSGTLTKQSTRWWGTIEVSATGSAVFGAKAKKADGSLVWVGRAIQVLTGSGDSVALTLSAVSLKAGSILGNALSLSGYVKTIAGSAGNSGSTNGTGSAARFNSVSGVTTNGTYLYVTDSEGHLIRKINMASNEVSTLAGTGLPGSTDNATGTLAKFDTPRGITNDGTNLYVADEWNSAVRKISLSTGSVSTLAALGGRPRGLTQFGSYLYVAVFSTHLIKRVNVSTGAVTTFAGSTQGTSDGTGTAAKFNGPTDVTTDGTYLYVTDQNSHTIRRIGLSDQVVTTIAGSAGISGTEDGVGTSARLYAPTGLTNDGSRLYIVDNSCTIRVMDLASSTVSTLVGIAGTSGAVDGGPGTALLNYASHISTDGVGLYFADTFSHTVRRIQ